MDDARKAELTEAFLAHRLSEAEARELSAAIDADPSLGEELNFAAKLQTATEREGLRENLEETHAAIKRKKRLRALVVAAVVVSLAVLAWLLLREPADELPFSPEEGRTLLREVIAYNQRAGELGVSAGTGDWQGALLRAFDDPDRFPEAAGVIDSGLVGYPACNDAVLEYFRGNIDLYLERDARSAAERFSCVKSLAPGRFDEALQLPELLMQLAGPEYEAAVTAFRETEWSLDTLPGAARALVGE